VIRPGSAASAQKSWIPGLGIVIALLVCIGLMVHVASIDADTTTAVSAAASVDRDTVILSDSAPAESEMTSNMEGLELCAFLGVMCALMLLVLRQLTGLPDRSDRSAPRQSSDLQGAFPTQSGSPVSVSALMVPLRV
jgi:hypothetical protein